MYRLQSVWSRFRPKQAMARQVLKWRAGVKKHRVAESVMLTAAGLDELFDMPGLLIWAFVMLIWRIQERAGVWEPFSAACPQMHLAYYVAGTACNDEFNGACARRQLSRPRPRLPRACRQRSMGAGHLSARHRPSPCRTLRSGAESGRCAELEFTEMLTWH